MQVVGKTPNRGSSGPGSCGASCQVGCPFLRDEFTEYVVSKSGLAIFFLLVLLAPVCPLLACPPTGSHIGVVLREASAADEVVSRLEDIGVEASIQEKALPVGSDDQAAFETVIFPLGYWLPSGPLEPEKILADARIYLGDRTMALKVNTTLSGSRRPLRDALAILLLAGVIEGLPDPESFVQTNGNVYPPDVVVDWAMEEYGVDLEQVAFRCGPDHAEVLVQEMAAEQGAVIIANSIDASLCVPILEPALEDQGIFWSLVSAEDFHYYSNSQLIIVLGGPDAYYGIANVSRFVLPPLTSQYLRELDEATVVHPGQPSFESQVIVIIAGHDRYSTRKAVEDFVESGGLEDLVEQTEGSRPKVFYDFSVGCFPPHPETSVEAGPGRVQILTGGTLSNPCHTILVEHDISAGKISVSLQYLAIPVVCVECLGEATVEITLSGIQPGDYEVEVEGVSYAITVASG